MKTNLSLEGQKLWQKGASYYPRPKNLPKKIGKKGVKDPSSLNSPRPGIKKNNAASPSVKGKSASFYPRKK